MNSENDDPSSLDLEGRRKLIAQYCGKAWDEVLIEMLYGHYPSLTKKELAVCLAHCYFIWDQKGYPYNYEGVIDYSINVGRENSMRINGKELFSNRQEIEETIQQLKIKGIEKLNIDFLNKGLTARCNTGTCTRIYFQPLKRLNLKDEIEDDAFMIASDALRGVVLRAFGPVTSE